VIIAPPAISEYRKVWELKRGSGESGKKSAKSGERKSGEREP